VKRISLAIVVLLVSGQAFAGNGLNLIAPTAASRGMGGVGVATKNSGADALFKNASLLVNRKGHKGKKHGKYEASLWGTYFYLIGDSQLDTNGVKETNNKAVIPGVALTYKHNPKWAFGLGFATLGGATTDYKEHTELSELKVEYASSRLQGAIAYKINKKWSVSLTPSLVMSSLAINLNEGAGQTTREPDDQRDFGLELGTTFKPNKKWTFGFSYKAPVKQEFEQVVDIELFGAGADGIRDNITLDQPAEYALGTSYRVNKVWTIGFDYRYIDWGNAEGFETFDWDSQHVFALGTQYRYKKWKFRAGLNHSTRITDDVSGENGLGTVDLGNHSAYRRNISLLNVVGFPVYATTHLTMGAGYKVMKNLKVDAAYVYGFENDIARSGTLVGSYDFKGHIKSNSLTLGMTYKF